MQLMKNRYSKILSAAILIASLAGCTKEKYALGDLKAPESLAVNTLVAGVDASNPNGNGTGQVTITATSTNALSYKMDYGDGVTEMIPGGAVTHKYTTPGTNLYTVTVNAIGTGGVTSTISKQITGFVAFEIPANILQPLTGAGSKVWVTNRDAAVHFCVGPSDAFGPIWYAAGPNTREACAYDDEITFARDANNMISMTVENKDQSFSIGASTSFYGFAGGDGCYSINPGGTKIDRKSVV